MFSGVEDPSRVIVIVEWDSVEAHAQHRGTPAHNHMCEVASKITDG
jgi:heme-degrading monooxygenase HmoA